MDEQELNDTWDLICDTVVLGVLDYWGRFDVWRTQGYIDLINTKSGKPKRFFKEKVPDTVRAIKHMAIDGKLRKDLADAVLQDDFDSEAVDVMIQVAMLGEITYG